MKVTVKLFATLRIDRQKIMEMDVEEGTTPQDIAQLLDIPLQEIAIIMINGRGSAFDCRLEDQDVLALFPPVGGG